MCGTPKSFGQQKTNAEASRKIRSQVQEKANEFAATAEDSARAWVHELATDAVGSRNLQMLQDTASMSKETLEMAQKMKRGKVSSKDMVHFLMKQAHDNPEMTEDLQAKALEKLDTFGLNHMKAEMDTVKDTLAEGVADIQVQAEDTLAENGIDSGLLGIVMSVIKPILVSGIHNLHKKEYAHQPELCNKAAGEMLLEVCTGWRRLLFLWKQLANMTPRTCSALILLYFLFALVLLPGNVLFNHPVDGFPTSPKAVTGTWEIRNYIFFAILVILPPGLLANVKMIRNNAKLELCGSMMAQLQTRYCPDVEAASTNDAMWSSHPVIRGTLRSMRVASDRNSKLCCAFCAAGCLAVSYHYIVNKFTVTHNPYWLLHLAMFVVFIPVSLSSIFAAVVLVCSECDLLKRNIDAYGELVDVMCLHVDLVADKVKSKMQGVSVKQSLQEGKSSDRSDSLHAAIVKAVSEDPIVAALQDQLQAYEQYMVRLAQCIIKGRTGKTVNFLYACMFTGYFLILFWVYVIFIEIRAKRFHDHSKEISMGVGLVACTVLSIICILQPLLAMARQAQAWVKLTNSFKTEARQRVSAVLSAKGDRFELLNHYSGMQEQFTWKVCGMQMLASVIATAISSYFAIMWPRSCFQLFKIMQMI
jgi:hypothetical protein